MRELAQPQDPLREIIAWLLEKGLEGASRAILIDGYCERLNTLGVPLYRFHISQTALHPVYGGTGYSWCRNMGGGTLAQYEYTDEPASVWLQSPFYHLIQSNTEDLRIRLSGSPEEDRFPVLSDLRAEGATDYYAAAVLMDAPQKMTQADSNDPPDGIMVSWTSDAENGFSEADLDLIKETLHHFSLALKANSNSQKASDLLSVYLGRDAGRRVLSGEIRRGSLQEIDAVLWDFDLAGFTAMSERLPGPEMIALLNDYLAVATEVIHAHDGNILKFMGDGIMAMFDLGEIDEDAQAALTAAAALRGRMADLNTERSAAGLPVLDYTLAMHAGEILYGNIGGRDRLDFTVIGPTVNQTARIAGMHKALGQKTILSEDVAEAARGQDHDLVSLGRYMLRGVSEPMELFTIYGGAPADAP